MKVLVCDSIAQEGKDILAAEPGIECDDRAGISVEELKEIIGQYDGVIVRSRTKLTAEILENTDNRKAIARAGVGIDNVDVAAASRRGVIVMNTPGGNTLSTAEHTIALMMALARNLPRACEDLRAKNWNRKKFVGSQLAGKTLVLVGLGRIGAAVAKRAVAMEMSVIGVDPFLTQERAKRLGICLVDDLDEALRQGDYITIHTPLTEETRGLISTKQFEIMKNEARIINCARGGIVDEEALRKALVGGQIAGAALDVYTEEPPKNRDLIELDNVVATPHLGASTEEAQVNVAVEAATQMIDALLHDNVRFALNMATVDAPQRDMLAPYVVLAEKIGSFQRQLASGRVSAVEVTCSGDVADLPSVPITAAVLKGFLGGIVEENVNAINAPLLAEERGISVDQKKSGHPTDYANLIEIRVAAGSEARYIAGTVLGVGDIRIVAIDDYRTDLAPSGDLIVVFGKDRPGLIGKVGADMAAKGVNIAGMTFARNEAGGNAICVLNLDGPAPKEALDNLFSVEDVTSVHLVSL